jgi:hypothetical protein
MLCVTAAAAAGVGMSVSVVARLRERLLRPGF